MQWMTPVGRGFDSSFGFLGGSEDHFEHTTGGNLFGCTGQRAVDLYRSNRTGAEWCLAHTGGPHCNGTHGAYLFNAETLSIISAHDASIPLFLYVATQDAHGPDQITAKYHLRDISMTEICTCL
jgi:arylsulfatase B